ncbi:MAG: hypothetical protein JO112_03060, partial [Planctomycetes bacterium]|nr:hypothetical protein [Planctomycetota bacterium]
LVSGCSLFYNGTRSVVFSASRTVENATQAIHNRELAEAAWKSFHHANPGPKYSEDFACGFEEGFADYLRAGGSGEPPPFPPHKYWKTCYETPEGFQAAEDWFAGFRQGSAAARESGLRQFIILPSSLGSAEAGPPAGPDHPGPKECPTPPGPLLPGRDWGVSPGESLPPPRPVDAEKEIPPAREPDASQIPLEKEVWHPPQPAATPQAAYLPNTRPSAPEENPRTTTGLPRARVMNVHQRGPQEQNATWDRSSALPLKALPAAATSPESRGGEVRASSSPFFPSGTKADQRSSGSDGVSWWSAPQKPGAAASQDPPDGKPEPTTSPAAQHGEANSW